MTQRQKQISMGAGAAIVIVTGIVYWFWRPANNPNAQRYEDGPPGVPVPAQGDRATAMALVSAILMGLMQRMKTGEGSWVGTSLLSNGLWSCGVVAQAALCGAYLPHRPPPDRPRSALGNIYRTSDDRWLQLTIVREDKTFNAKQFLVGARAAYDMIVTAYASGDRRQLRSTDRATALQ